MHEFEVHMQPDMVNCPLFSTGLQEQTLGIIMLWEQTSPAVHLRRFRGELYVAHSELSWLRLYGTSGRCR